MKKNPGKYRIMADQTVTNKESYLQKLRREKKEEEEQKLKKKKEEEELKRLRALMRLAIFLTIGILALSILHVILNT